MKFKNELDKDHFVAGTCSMFITMGLIIGVSLI